MSSWIFVIAPFVLWATATGYEYSSSTVKMIDGGYSDIVVELSPCLDCVPAVNCSEYLTAVEDSFRECSRLLYESTQGRAYFLSLDIVLAPQWNTTSCQRDVIKSSVVRETDIHVGPTHPLFGDEPWTQHSRGCRQPGDFISLSDAYFTNRSTNKTQRGQQLLQQWTQYRYGIVKNDKCQRSISPTEMILHHDDFRETSQQAPVAFRPLVFNYRTPGWPKLIAAVDHAIGGLDRDAWNYTRVALRMLLDYMNPRMHFGLIAFSDTTETRVYHKLVPVRAGHLDSLTPMPAYAEPVVDDESCLFCALDRAVRMLEADGASAAGHTIFVITSASFSRQQVVNATRLAVEKEVQVSVIVLGRASTPHLASLVRETEGFFGIVPVRFTPAVDFQRNTFLNLSVVLDLEDALVSALALHRGVRRTQLPVVIHQNVYNVGPKSLIGNKELRKGSFVIGSRVQGAILRLYFSQTENMYSVLGFKVTNSSYTLTGKRFFPLDVKPWVYSWPYSDTDTCFSHPSNWTYQFFRRYPTIQPNYVRVLARLTPDATNEMTPTISWKIFSSNASLANQTRTLLVAVQWNQLPVWSCRVQATIRPNDQFWPSIKILLLDDGVEDFTRADGVYTGHFVFSEAATVSLQVDDNEGQAFTVGKPINESIECCGSPVTDIPKENRLKLGPFNWTADVKLKSPKTASMSTTEISATSPLLDSEATSLSSGKLSIVSESGVKFNHTSQLEPFETRSISIQTLQPIFLRPLFSLETVKMRSTKSFTKATSNQITSATTMASDISPFKVSGDHSFTVQSATDRAILIPNIESHSKPIKNLVSRSSSNALCFPQVTIFVLCILIRFFGMRL